MKVQHRIFADAYVVSDNVIESYKEAYPSATKKCSARVGGYKLLQKADVSAYIQDEKERLKNAASKKVIEDLSSTELSQTLSYNQKRGILYEIAVNGTFKLNTYTTTWKLKTYIQKALVADRLKAIEIDNKMTGEDKLKRASHEEKIEVIFMSVSKEEAIRIQQENKNNLKNNHLISSV